MSKNHEMVAVILYKDGTWEIEDIDSNYETQKLYGFKGGRSCDIYHCKKGKEYYYIDIMMKELIEENKNKIKELKNKNKILLEQLLNFKKDFEGGN